MTEASPGQTSETGPGWKDTESCGYFDPKSEIGQNSGFVVDVESDDWITMDADSIVDTASSYYADTNTGFVITMTQESASANAYNNAYSSTDVDATGG